MKYVDTETLPDMDAGWPGTKLGCGDTEGLDVSTFEEDVKCILIDKADGDIHTRITNAKCQGGAFLYADVYKWYVRFRAG